MNFRNTSLRNDGASVLRICTTRPPRILIGGLIGHYALAYSRFGRFGFLGPPPLHKSLLDSVPEGGDFLGGVVLYFLLKQGDEPEDRYANKSRTTWPWTSVSRMSRPPKGNVNLR
jgi:hypothetical protein